MARARNIRDFGLRNSAATTFLLKNLTPGFLCQLGVSEFTAPSAGRAYGALPEGSHRYVSTGIVSGIETFRCIQCNESYMLYHIEHAEISPTVDTERPGA